jgi:hypothetical protein
MPSWGKGLAGISQLGDLGRHFSICRCQNGYEGANDRGNTVEMCLDGFYGLGTLSFHGLLSFHLDFQLQKPGAGAKNGILERDARFFLPNTGTMMFPRE